MDMGIDCLTEICLFFILFNSCNYIFLQYNFVVVLNFDGPLNVLLIPGWEWSGSSHYLQNALMVMRLTQPLTAKS